MSARDAAAAALHPVGTVVDVVVHSIGGRQERVSATVTGHKFGQVRARCESHGELAIPLDKVLR